MHNTTGSDVLKNDTAESLQQLSNTVQIFLLVLWTLTICIGVVGNTLLSLTIACTVSLRSAMNIYVLGIALVDLLTCSLMVPLRVAINRERAFGESIIDSMYSSELFIRTFTDVARLLLMQFLSVERYQAIARPFAVTKIQAKRRAFIICAGVCAVSVIISVLSVRYLCDTVLYDPCFNHETNQMNGWGNLEVYVEFPLTVISVFAIVISYGLIVLVLREQRKKMGKHAKPKINQVAPQVDCKAAGTSGNTSVKVSLLDDASKDNNSKSEAVKEKQGPNLTEETLHVIDNAKDVLPSVDTDELKCKSEEGNGCMQESALTDPVDNTDETTLVGVQSAFVNNQTVPNEASSKSGSPDSKTKLFKVVENAGSDNFENGSREMKTYDKSLENTNSDDTKVQSTEVIDQSGSGRTTVKENMHSGIEQLSNSDTTEILSNEKVATTPAANVEMRLSKPNAMNCTPPSSEPQVSMDDNGVHNPERSQKKNSVGFVDQVDEIPQTSTIHLPLRDKLTCEEARLAKQRLSEMMQRTKTRSMSSPLLVVRSSAVQNNAEFQKDGVVAAPKIAAGHRVLTSRHSARSFKRPLNRSKTEKSILCRDNIFDKMHHVPYFTLPETSSTDAKMPSTILKDDSDFRPVDFTYAQNVGSGAGHNLETRSGRSDSVTTEGSDIYSGKNRLSESDQITFGMRKVSSQSFISHDAIDKDCISLKFETLLSSSEDESRETLKTTGFLLERDTSKEFSLKTLETDHTQSPLVPSQFSGGQIQPQQISSPQRMALTKPFAADAVSPEKTKEDNTQTSSNDVPSTVLPDKATDSSNKKETDITTDKSVLDPSKIKETADDKKVEVVEMDGTVHLEVVKNSPDAAAIEGAVCLMNPRNKEQGRRRVELKAALKVGLLFCCFVCLWMPLPVSVLVMKGRNSWADSLQVEFLTVFSAFASSTAAVDPILYGLLNRQIRQAFLAAVGRAKRKLLNYFKT